MSETNLPPETELTAPPEGTGNAPIVPPAARNEPPASPAGETEPEAGKKGAKKTLTVAEVGKMVSSLARVVKELSGKLDLTLDQVSELRTKVENQPPAAPAITSQPLGRPLNLAVNGTTPPPAAAPQAQLSTFLTAVPSDLLGVAQSVLGDKFGFECIACKDRPFFEFVVIVPQEYSEQPIGTQDRRSRLISNSTASDGVKAWCTLVKENIIKKIGTKLPTNV